VSEKFTGEIETIEKPIRSLGNKIFYQWNEKYNGELPQQTRTSKSKNIWN
jgi:hypothetical protein